MNVPSATSANLIGCPGSPSPFLSGIVTVGANSMLQNPTVRFGGHVAVNAVSCALRRAR